MLDELLLPIGSVVLLKGGEKRLMICGRIQTRAGEDVIYDYSACLFPEGLYDPKHMYFFNKDKIQRVYLVGMQDPEELAYASKLKEMGEFVVENGKIVPKNKVSTQ